MESRPYRLCEVGERLRRRCSRVRSEHDRSTAVHPGARRRLDRHLAHDRRAHLARREPHGLVGPEDGVPGAAAGAVKVRHVEHEAEDLRTRPKSRQRGRAGRGNGR